VKLGVEVIWFDGTTYFCFCMKGQTVSPPGSKISRCLEWFGEARLLCTYLRVVLHQVNLMRKPRQFGVSAVELLSYQASSFSKFDSAARLREPRVIAAIIAFSRILSWACGYVGSAQRVGRARGGS